MKSAILILCCLCIIGCKAKEDLSDNSSQTTSPPPVIQVQTIESRHGDFPIPDFVQGKTYTAHLGNTDFDSITENTKIINLTTTTDYFDNDLPRFILLDETGKKVVDCRFYSSYGNYLIDFVDLNGDNKKEIVFILGEGRGTSVRRETLGVFEVVDDGIKSGGLRELYSTKYSDWWGLVARWWYDRSYKDTNNDGITDLELTLDRSPIGVDPQRESPEDIPKTRTKIFSFKTSESSKTSDKLDSINQLGVITKEGDFPVPEFSGNKTYTARIISHPDYHNATVSDEDWPAEDWFKFILLDEGGEELIEHTFRSSYGKFKIEFVDLNNDQYKEVIFILGQGRGTNARGEDLFVYELAGRCLQLLYSTPNMNWYGPNNRWWYDHHYRDTNNDGTVDLELILDYDSIGQSHLEVPQLIPHEKVKVFRTENIGFIKESAPESEVAEKIT